VLDSPVERITTNLKFTVKNTVNQSDWHDLKTSDYGKFDSVCNETMVGFWQTSGQVSCVVGKQINKNDDIVLDEQKTWSKQAYFKV
jgi:hypothetical protein